MVAHCPLYHTILPQHESERKLEQYFLGCPVQERARGTREPIQGTCCRFSFLFLFLFLPPFLVRCCPRPDVLNHGRTIAILKPRVPVPASVPLLSSFANPTLLQPPSYRAEPLRIALGATVEDALQI